MMEEGEEVKVIEGRDCPFGLFGSNFGNLGELIVSGRESIFKWLR
jgi:hypothetical protein